MRSVRRNGRVVQETVAHLGELDAAGRAKARALARQITGRGTQRELFEADIPPGEAIAVRLEDVPLLALAEALADLVQLLDRLLDRPVQPRDLGFHFLRRNVEPGNAGTTPIHREHAPDRDAW